MNRRQRKPSSSKRANRNVENATIGSHIPKHTTKSTRQSASSKGTYNVPRKTTRGQRGVVDHVLPASATQESQSAYSRRVSRLEYNQALRKKARRKSRVIATLVIGAILVVAVGVGGFAYMGSVSEKLGLGDSNAQSALVAQEAETPYYTLVVGEFLRPGSKTKFPGLIMLARIDEAAKQVTLLSVPWNTQVSLSDGKTNNIAYAQQLGGDAALIEAVSGLADVPISHIAKTDADQFTRLVDKLGGITVEVTEEVDDPRVGDIYIPQGTQKLDGKSVLTFCRAWNYAEGYDKRTQNQMQLASVLGSQLINTDFAGSIFTLDQIAEDIQTDYAAGDLLALSNSLSGLTSENIYTVQLPGYTFVEPSDGSNSYYVTESVWEGVRAAIKAGDDPTETLSMPIDVDPASFTITVRNGSGVTGGAAAVADVLSGREFQITETGNADQFVYDTTLVVYKDSEQLEAAKAVVNALGVGRTVASNGLYAFESDVLVMVGKDWKPLT